MLTSWAWAGVDISMAEMQNIKPTNKTISFFMPSSSFFTGGVDAVRVWDCLGRDIQACTAAPIAFSRRWQ
jgi:hypothetical protein